MSDTDLNTIQRKQLVSSLATALRVVHSTLIQGLKKKREGKLGRELTPVEWFNELSTGEDYVWIRELTSLMSDIDALMDNRAEISANDSAIVRAGADALFNDDHGGFKNRFFDAMVTDTDLIAPQALLTRILEAWPRDPVSGIPTEERRAWHIGERRLKHIRKTEQKNKNH